MQTALLVAAVLIGGFILLILGAVFMVRTKRFKKYLLNEKMDNKAEVDRKVLRIQWILITSLITFFVTLYFSPNTKFLHDYLRSLF